MVGTVLEKLNSTRVEVKDMFMFYFFLSSCQCFTMRMMSLLSLLYTLLLFCVHFAMHRLLPILSSTL